MKKSQNYFEFDDFSCVPLVRNAIWEKSNDDNFSFGEPALPCDWGVNKRNDNNLLKSQLNIKTQDQSDISDMEYRSVDPVKIKHRKSHKNNIEKLARNEEEFPQSMASDQYDMHQLENIALRKLTIRRIHGKLFYFTGKSYYPLDRNLFLQQLRIILPGKILRKIATFSKLEEVYKYLLTNPDINLEVSDEMKEHVGHLIAFENGIYDVWNDRLLGHSPKFPLLFDVSAKYVSGKCKTPCFDAYLEEVSNGNNSTKELIWQIVGYLLLHNTSAKCFFILGTAANSGKSLLGEFICSLFAEELVGSVPLTELGGRFALGSLWKKAVNISMDLPTRTLSEQEVSQIKMLTGERRIRTEEKYEPVTTTYIHCKSIFATNGKITLKTRDDAFWDRVVFVPFMHSVPEKKRDRGLLEKLLAEKDGIVSRAAREVRKLIERNYCFKMPEEAHLILNEWKCYATDTISDFLEKQCIYGPEHEIFSEELYSAYKWYCVSQAQEPETRIAFSRKISKLPGVTQRKKRRTATDNPIWLFEGIAIGDEREG